MSAYLSLEDADGNIYNFDPSFWLTTDSWKTTVNVKNKPFAPGGKNVSDGELEARTLVIEGSLRADTLAALETKLRALQRAVRLGGKLRVSDDTVNRYITVSNPVVDSEFQGDYRLEKRFNISYVVEYPFWEDLVETEDSNILAGDDTFYVDNSGSDTFIYPIIEIENSVDNPSVKLTNVSDSGMSFEYNDPDFFNGDVLVIDCREGTVKKNNNNTIQYFNPARFLRLQNLNNEIQYEGAACTINVKYRKVYL